MLAPVALYPDGLLSQILMAATYPLEVVEAQRWTLANPSVTGNAAVQAVDQNNWDPSVKSLVAFPRILQTMSSKLDWTRRLGDAFLGQQQQVMDTIQALRAKAYAAGYLASNAQTQVSTVDGQITVLPTNPQIVYAPYYDPGVVYGPWWWPQYPPVSWAPWPGYGWYGGFSWGLGIGVGGGFFFGDCDWPHHQLVDHRPRSVISSVWHYDPAHRRGVPYRNPVLNRQFGRVPANAPAQAEFRGHQPTAPTGSFRGNQPGAPTRSFRGNQPTAPTGNFRGPPLSAPVGAESRPHVFENVGRGVETRSFSNRGQAVFSGHSSSAAPGQGSARPRR